MKMDMSGAAAVLSSMSALAALQCRDDVTGYLMCTDNMPSGSAMKLGDVLTIHGGKTVEIHNTDAEGRLVLADGLALAARSSRTRSSTSPRSPARAWWRSDRRWPACSATTSVRRTGARRPPRRRRGGVAAAAGKEQYRKLLDSDVADMKNVGGPYGGAITAAMFLSEFVGDTRGPTSTSPVR